MDVKNYTWNESIEIRIESIGTSETLYDEANVG